MIQKNQTSKNKTFRLSQRRAGAEVIASLLLVAITVIGAVILTTFVDDNFVAASLAETTPDVSSNFVTLLAYDTRDSSSLFQIANLDNSFGDDVLLGSSVNPADINKIPSNGGTEFIVMQIQNNGVNSIWLENVYLNGVDHTWDNNTGGKTLDASADDSTGKYPIDGKFSILEKSSSVQNSSAEIESGKTVNLVVKLSAEDQDFELNKSMRVLLNIGTIQHIDFVIESGDAK